MFKKLALSVFALSVFVVSSAFTPSNVSANNCPIGKAKNANGLCVNITTQRPVVSAASKKASAYAICLTNTPNWTPAKQKSCMKAKGYK